MANIVWGYWDAIGKYKKTKWDWFWVIAFSLGTILFIIDKNYFFAAIYFSWGYCQLKIRILEDRIKKQDDLIKELNEYKELFVDTLNK